MWAYHAKRSSVPCPISILSYDGHPTITGMPLEAAHISAIGIEYCNKSLEWPVSPALTTNYMAILHLTPGFNGQMQLQDERRHIKVLGFGDTFTRGWMVSNPHAQSLN